VFQDFNLLDTFTLEDNIYLPLVLAGKSHAEMEKKLLPLAMDLGIADLLKKYPYEVSGGQKQRAAVARALITEPKLLLADEPTGALDEKTGRQVLNHIIELQKKQGFTMIMVTHNANIAETADRIIKMNSGKIVSVTQNAGKKTAYEIGW
jgi:putative ABC transport system ATP-binding protein